MNTSAPSTERFQVRVTSDSHFGWIRTRMALERTLMAWVRTSVGLIGFGFTIVQFYQRLRDMTGVAPPVRPQAPRTLGLALIGTGVVTLLVAVAQYRAIVRYLWSEEFKVLAGLESQPTDSIAWQMPILTVAGAVILIGIFAFASVVFRIA
jgi:inner membrane protein YidH